MRDPASLIALATGSSRCPNERDAFPSRSGRGDSRALEAFKANGDNPFAFLMRHLSGDWGEVDPEEAFANDMGLPRGERLLSAYRMSDGTRFWIITEADCSCTTLLLPEEY